MTDWATRLRAAGLRVTQPRLTVLAAVAGDPHQTADQVAAHVRTVAGTVSTQAVYDTLNTLTAHHLLRRIEPAGSPMRFEVFRGDNHHHLVCRTCGRVEDVPCAVGTMPCAVPADTAGYTVEQAEVTYWGRCPDCTAADRASLDNVHP